MGGMMRKRDRVNSLPLYIEVRGTLIAADKFDDMIMAAKRDDKEEYEYLKKCL